MLFLCNNGRYFLAHWAERAAAAAARFDVVVAVPNPQEDARAPWRWARVRLDRRSLGAISNVASLASVLTLLRRERPDVVVSVTIKPNLLAGIAARLGVARAVVMNVTGLGYLFLSDRPGVRLARQVVVRLLRWCAAAPRVWLVYENDEDRALLLGAGVGTAERSLLLGGAGVDTALFAPRGGDDEPDADPIVVLPARLLWDKGVGEFVEAARLLRADGVRARFVLVGEPDEGNPSSVAAADVARWRDGGDVECWGHRGDMPAVMAAATVVCLPSYREGLPRVLLEASAAARPIITTDAPGCRSVIRDGVTGLLVPPRDAAALARAIRALLRDPELRRRLGAAARAAAVAEYDERLVLRRSIGLYETAAETDDRGPTARGDAASVSAGR